MANIDWLSIKNEYVNTNTSYRKLAQKYGVNKDTIAKRAQSENWAKAKDIQTDKIQTMTIQKTADKIVASEVNRIERLTKVGDKLLAKIEQATSEIDTDIDGKTIQVDTYKLRQITQSLKDIKDIQTPAHKNEMQLDKLDMVLNKIGGEI